MIPEDWEVQRIGDICDFIVPGRNKPRIFNGDIPWITTPDLEDGGSVSESKLGLFVSRDEAKNVGSKIVPSGSVIMTCVGELGIVAFVKRDIVINQQLHAFIPSSIIDATFLLNALKAQKKHMGSLSTVTAVPYLNKDNCNSILIPFPPLPEQRAIAAVLSDVDALITALDRLIAKKRAIKQGVMQQLLTGKTRLPGFGGGWEVKNLGEMGGCIRGVSYNGESDLHPYDTDDTVRLLRANNVQDATIVSNDLQFVNSRRVADEQILLEDDIVICMSSGSKELVGKTAFFNLEDGFRYTFGAFMGCFRINRNLVDSSFVSFWLQTQEYRDFISILLSGSSINNLKPGDIESIIVLLPPLPEQRTIATILSDMDAEIAALEARRDKTRALKQGMMQELLTGRIRLVG
jgi:type I restriction enzyme S subunit